MGMIYCRGCGQHIDDGAPACPHCGAVRIAAPNLGTSAGSTGAGINTQGVPDGIKGWSWGAFLLNGIWAIGNRTWIGLLAFIPLLGFPMIIMLGIKGREWAWKSKPWQSVEHFNAVQKKWSLWGGIIAGLYGLAIAVVLIKGHLHHEQDQDAASGNYQFPDDSNGAAKDGTGNTPNDIISAPVQLAPGAMPQPHGDTTGNTPDTQSAQSNSATALPFVGKRFFNFMGGSGTGLSITIGAGGQTKIESCGDPSAGGTCETEYNGPYVGAMQAANGEGWSIRGNAIFKLQNGEPDTSCGDDGKQPCQTTLETN